MINEKNFKDVTNFLRNISDIASQKILDIYKSKITYKIKNDLSPVTVADIESNEIICKNIKKEFSKIPIISEENKKKSLKSDTYFLIDPLDGTKEFIQRNGEFTVNIALIIKNEPTLGVIQVPVKKTQYFSDGLNSFKFNGDLKKIFSYSSNNNMRFLTSRSHIDDDTEKIINKLKNVQFLKMGSSLKFCHLAEGKADIYIRNGKTMSWDVAAGIAILKNAGGSIKTLNLKEFVLNKNNFINNPFICFRNDFPNEKIKFISEQYNLITKK